MDIYFLIGVTASVCVGIQFIPQLIKVYKTNQTRDISGYTLFLTIIGNILWTVYGLSKADIPIILASILILICAIEIARVKYTHHRDSKK